MQYWLYFLLSMLCIAKTRLSYIAGLAKMDRQGKTGRQQGSLFFFSFS